MKHVVRASAFVLFVGITTPLAAAAPEAPPPPPQEVTGPEISMLIRTTMIALHQANLTGNYTVLRDLGASVMQASNSAADLATLFVEFRKAKLNLAPTVLFDAVLDAKPALSTNGVLKLVGHFPTKPQEIVFDMTFSYELGSWKIAIISVGSRMAVADANPVDPPPATKPKAKSDRSQAAAKPKPDPNAAIELVPPAK